jgi:hypothetical protein
MRSGSRLASGEPLAMNLFPGLFRLGLSPLAAPMVAVLAVAGAYGCGEGDGESGPDAPLDGEHAAESDEASSAAEAVTAHAAEKLSAVSPPEARVATSDVRASAGAHVAAGARLFVVRTLELDGAPTSMVTNADTLETSVVRSAALAASSRAASAADEPAASPYATSLAETARLAAQNRALDRVAPNARTGDASEPFALTVDMCQSRKPWDEALFAWAVALSTTLRKPVPVGIAMTGGWARAHPAELDRIVSWSTAGKLAITWINHSATHPLHCLDAACRRAEFLTAHEVDFDAEVLGLEQALLARGLAPSVLFRFPGLVHDARRLEQLARLSLLPLDANAWVAKGQPLAARAVVLVHGNGNEPPGVSGFLRAVQDGPRASALASGRLALVSPLLVAPSPPVDR